jgi:5-methylcytosine-specific restriction endonuclease McrA
MGIVSGYRGVNLVLQGKAVSLDDSNLVIRSPELQLAVPYVVRLSYYVNIQNLKTRIPFSRKGVMARDGGKCAYCGKTANTIDHIVPKSKGGENSYQNCVASCMKCNSHKSNRSLQDSGLQLKQPPYEPTIFTSILFKAMHDDEMFQSWSNYVFMYQPNLKDSFMLLNKI